MHRTHVHHTMVANRADACDCALTSDSVYMRQLVLGEIALTWAQANAILASAEVLAAGYPDGTPGVTPGSAKTPWNFSNTTKEVLAISRTADGFQGPVRLVQWKYLGIRCHEKLGSDQAPGGEPPSSSTNTTIWRALCLD